MTATPTTWPADKVERRPVSDLIPYARNSRTHSAEQVSQIAASIREWGWTVPVLIEPDGGLIAGHGRVMAAQQLGIEDVPCMIAEGWSDAKKRAYIIADNKLALNAEWDDDLLRLELKDIADDFDIGLTGFSEDELANLFDIDGRGLDDNYSRSIEAPIYEITGDEPDISSLTDRTKAEELAAEVEGADIPDDVAEFLLFAAERHTIFDFARIAEFYAHADPVVQDLMERSALVIIDFDKAIECGYVRLSEGMLEQVGYIKEAKANAE